MQLISESDLADFAMDCFDASAIGSDMPNPLKAPICNMLRREILSGV
jgi:hypothetical protein